MSVRICKAISFKTEDWVEGVHFVIGDNNYIGVVNNNLINKLLFINSQFKIQYNKVAPDTKVADCNSLVDWYLIDKSTLCNKLDDCYWFKDLYEHDEIIVTSLNGEQFSGEVLYSNDTYSYVVLGEFGIKSLSDFIKDIKEFKVTGNRIDETYFR